MNNNGISLISLIVTIVVIIILASITVFNSFDVLEDSYISKKEKEYNDVCSFVTSISVKAEADIIDLELTDSTLVTIDQIDEFYIYNVETDFTSGDTHKIISMNESINDEGLEPKYGYHYITGKQIENGIPGININSGLEKVENNYIINFYYGVVIAKISETKTNVTGAIR